jgi:hypothetical protein
MSVAVPARNSSNDELTWRMVSLTAAKTNRIYHGTRGQYRAVRIGESTYV